MVDARTARRMWMLLEPVHAVTYFAAEPRRAFEALGLKGFWRGYFAGRSAPLGAIGPAPVVALFYGFAPAMVTRALPEVWSRADPQAVLRARLTGALEALEVPAAAAGEGLAEAAALARAAVEGAEVGGRALGSANAALPWPSEPLADIWQAATALRELRGDGHVAALLTSGLSGLDALVMRAGVDLDRALLQPSRGWNDEEWDAAADDLRARGLLAADNTATGRGRQVMADVETVTDHLAVDPWTALGDVRTGRFADLIGPLSAAAAELLPPLTPIGLPARVSSHEVTE